MIKAIETNYKGYRFRSRLEARWAVFFDAIGIQWQYEAEGFHLPSGPYLPDFTIDYSVDGTPQRGFLEIKGSEPTDVDRQLGDELAKATGACVVLVQGEPGAFVTYSFFPKAAQRGPDQDHLAQLAFMLWSYTGFTREFTATEIDRAVAAARGARFEHGESGAAR